MGFKVVGARQLDTVARVLTEKGNSPALKRRVTKALKSAADPITRDQRKNLAEKLPHRGGLADLLSGQVRTPIRTNWARATVDINDRWPGHDIKAIDSGRIRHPVFGEKRLKLTKDSRLVSAWVSQNITPDLLTQPFLDHKVTVVIAMAKEMDRLAQEIARET